MTNYYEIDRLSRSSLCEIKVSPYYFWSRHIGKKIQGQDTKCMKIGRAFHCAVLEPKKFNERYAVAYQINKRLRSGREEYAEFVKNNADKEIITFEEKELIDNLVSHVANYEPAKKLIETCEEKESEILYECMSYEFKSKLDALSSKHELILDLKTIGDVKNSKQVAQDAIKYNYAEQVFLYSYAFEQKFNKRPRFIFINVSKKLPYEISIYDATDFYDYGELSIKKLLTLYQECVDKWGNDPKVPWQDQNIQTLKLPTWAENELNEFKLD